MMHHSERSQPPATYARISLVLLSLLLVATPSAVFAHAGHGNEFQHTDAATQTADSIQVDTETAKRLGIKVEPVKRQQLAIGIKTTGQIETLPNKQVEVTTPIASAKVVQLLVEPGAYVRVGQPVAVLAAADLIELRVTSQEKRAEGQADLQQAQADLRLAQQNLERQRQIASAEIEQASTEVRVAQEQYDRDQELVSAGALPRRNMLESQAHLREGQAQLTKAISRSEVIEAEAQLKRAQSAVEVAQSRIRLSNATYQARLQQLGTRANEKGLVTITAPISGSVADREATLGQSFEDAGGKLMTIVNDAQVYATANIYEKDLDKVKTGQRVSVKVSSLPNRTFTGQVAVIGSVVAGETRVVPVRTRLDNLDGVLKPGMFAELEVLTDQTPTAILVIPTSAVVAANGKQLVYIQNGNAFQSAEVTLGQTSGDMVEVKSGLFEGDLIVTQRAPQLYAQSLRGASLEGKSQKSKGQSKEDSSSQNPTPNIQNALPWWLVISAGGGVAVIAIASFWLGRRTKPQLVPTTAELTTLPEDSPNDPMHRGYSVLRNASSIGAASADEPQSWRDNHHLTSQESEVNSRK